MLGILLTCLTLLMYALLYVYMALFILVGLLLSYCAPRPLLNWLIKMWALGTFLIIGTRVRIVGRENIPSSRKYMILTNHASIFDIPAVMTVFPHVSWLGRDYLTKIPIFSHALKRANFVAIGRNPAMNVRLIIQKSIMNSENFVIALFPEGTRTKTGQLQKFKRGFIHIMNGGDLDILPVTMNGLYRIKPKTRFTITPFQTVEIIISEPIKKTSLLNLSNEEIISRVRDVFISNYQYKKGKTA